MQANFDKNFKWPRYDQFGTRSLQAAIAPNPSACDDAGFSAQVPAMPSLSIAIVLHDTPPARLQATLRSLLQALRRLEREGLAEPAGLWLIDNSRHAVPLPDLNSLWPYPVMLRHGHGNPGFGAGHNLALAETAADYHLILNPDVELAEDALCVGIAHLRRHPECMLVAPEGRHEHGAPLHLAKTRPNLLDLAVRGFLPHRLHTHFRRRLAAYERHDLQGRHEASEIELASGCFMLARTPALKSVGGFDPGFFLYFEDFDLSLRLKRLGRVMHLPGMRIVHFGGQAARKGRRHIGWFLRSAGRFFGKHGWRVL